MVTRLGIHHASLKVSDLERSVKFYEAIGCKKLLDMVNQFSFGVRRGALLDFGGGNCLEIFEGRKDDPTVNPHFVHLAIKSANCEEDYKKVLEAGGTALGVPSPDHMGDKNTIVVFVKGPDGETLEILQELD